MSKRYKILLAVLCAFNAVYPLMWYLGLNRGWRLTMRFPMLIPLLWAFAALALMPAAFAVRKFKQEPKWELRLSILLTILAGAGCIGGIDEGQTAPSLARLANFLCAAILMLRFAPGGVGRWLLGMFAATAGGILLLMCFYTGVTDTLQEDGTTLYVASPNGAHTAVISVPASMASPENSPVMVKIHENEPQMDLWIGQYYRRDWEIYRAYNGADTVRQLTWQDDQTVLIEGKEYDIS